MHRFRWALTAVLSLGLLALFGAELLSIEGLVTSQVAARNARLAASHKQADLYNVELQKLDTRWFGTPALYAAPPIDGTTIQYFDVTGTTQQEIISSFRAADICKIHGPCAVDPAVPNGVTLGLEWFDYAGGGVYCYTPASTTLAFNYYILLPRWSPPADGSMTIDLVERWNALAQVIYVHESGHVAIDKADLGALNAHAHHLANCDLVNAFWNSPHVFDKDVADQAAYHARLHADCRPEIGCIPAYWMGW